MVWRSFPGQDGDSIGVFARRFDSSGAPLSAADFQVNSYTIGPQNRSDIASDGAGGFLVAWDSEQGGATNDIFVQRLAATTLATLDIDGNGATDALTDGLLVLRHLFGFGGTTLTTGAVGGGCGRCDAATIVPYLQTLD
ncbi:MAG TPA: hypothetical protein VNB06_04470 [Thermoanaerobaculia bacterium]|nr:hypothetical protein [Thermoanaerobaculia bacterium]